MALDRSLGAAVLLANEKVGPDSSDIGGFCDVLGSALSGVLWLASHNPLLGGEAPEAWGVQGQDSQAQNIHSHFRVTLI